MHEVWQYNRSFYDKIIAERDAKMYVNDSIRSEYQALLDKKKITAVLDAIHEAGEDELLIYLYDRETDDGKRRSFTKIGTKLLTKFN